MRNTSGVALSLSPSSDAVCADCPAAVESNKPPREVEEVPPAPPPAVVLVAFVVVPLVVVALRLLGAPVR